jgi:hypothetical protein
MRGGRPRLCSWVEQPFREAKECGSRPGLLTGRSKTLSCPESLILDVPESLRNELAQRPLLPASKRTVCGQIHGCWLLPSGRITGSIGGPNRIGSNSFEKLICRFALQDYRNGLSCIRIRRPARHYFARKHSEYSQQARYFSPLNKVAALVSNDRRGQAGLANGLALPALSLALPSKIPTKVPATELLNRRSRNPPNMAQMAIHATAAAQVTSTPLKRGE